MPKVSKIKVHIRKDSTDFFYNLEVFYQTKQKFFAVLPTEFDGAIDILEADQLAEYSISHLRKGWLVTAETEANVSTRARKALQFLLDNAIKERPVIAIRFEEHGDPDNQVANDGQAFPAIGIEMEIDYCIEQRLGDQIKYVQRYLHNWHHNEDRLVEQKIDVSTWGGRHYVILDDTPENRDAISQLYSALRHIHAKLARMAESSDSFAKWISILQPGQQLLTYEE